MHRAYQPITPANNMLLKKRWDNTRYNAHRQKVHHSTAVIDNKPPKAYLHLHLNLKKMQKAEERSAQIDKENRLLLTKMSNILRTRGSIDHHNDYESKSLNKTKRQRELLRCTHENQAILRRLAAREPHYNHLQWEEEWIMKQFYMDNITKYPESRRGSKLHSSNSFRRQSTRRQSTRRQSNGPFLPEISK